MRIRHLCGKHVGSPRTRNSKAVAKLGHGEDEIDFDFSGGFTNWDDEDDSSTSASRGERSRSSASPRLPRDAAGGAAGGAAGWYDEQEYGPRKQRLPALEAELEMPREYCSGCGVRFQSKSESAPGYVPGKVLEERMAAAERQDTIVVAEDEEQEEREVLGRLKKKRPAVCQRCHALRYQNKLPADTLRVGGEGGSKTLMPSHFRDLLKSLKTRRCIVVCIVDLFDFHGSLVPDLEQIVGTNSPLMLVANKVDLMPVGVNLKSIERWIKYECRHANVPEISSLDLVSCKTGAGMPQMLNRLVKLMEYHKCDAYFLGAANAGKSSLLNYCIANVGKRKIQAKTLTKDESLTTSHLPGTTLDFVKITVVDGLALFDTPGLILPNQLTTMLTTEELGDAVPKKRSQHVTIRLGEGKSVLLGGLARINFLEGLPFMFTFYLANAVTIHPTKTDKVQEQLAKHIGTLLSPPSSIERLESLGTFAPHPITIEGRGWNEAAVDVVLPGLGWVAVTGCGSCKVSVELPVPVSPVLREPLLPEESYKKSYVKFTGTKLNSKRGPKRLR